jgi:hypothetical protein
MLAEATAAMSKKTTSFRCDSSLGTRTENEVVFERLMLQLLLQILADA